MERIDLLVLVERIDLLVLMDQAAAVLPEVPRLAEFDASEVEARIVPEGPRTRLIVEERGLPIDSSPAYRAGWQVHLEDLAAVLAGGERGDWAARWQQLHREGRPQG